MNPLSLLGYNWDAEGNLSGGPSAKSWTLAGLQGISSAAGIMSQMGATRAAGQSAKTSAYLQANDELINAQQAYVSGVGQVAGLRQQLSGVLGSRMAAAGASGVDGGQGIVQDNAQIISRNNDTAAGIARTNADIMATRHRMNALAAMMKGDQAEADANRAASAQLGTGILGALSSIGGLLLA